MIRALRDNVLYRVLRWSTPGESGDWDGDDGSHVQVASLDEADVVSSRLHPAPAVTGFTPKDMHSPVLDIDVPGEWIESSTPGHHHLYLDVAIPWDKYVRLLEVMSDCGILEPGYVGASISRGFTAARLPHVGKTYPSEPMQPPRRVTAIDEDLLNPDYNR